MGILDISHDYNQRPLDLPKIFLPFCPYCLYSMEEATFYIFKMLK